MATVILGSGIIGCSTAFYLAQSRSTPPNSIHLVDPSPELFASASGKAGGFLARDGFSKATAELSALSFQLHAELAAKYDGGKAWGYSRTVRMAIVDQNADDASEKVHRMLAPGVSEAAVRDAESSNFVSQQPTWLRGKKTPKLEMMSEEGTVAQVDPRRLSQFLLKKSLDLGVQLHHPAKALSISTDMRGELSSVRLLDTTTNAETDLPCTKLVITAGAWTPKVFKALFPDSPIRIPVHSMSGYSLLVKSPHWSTDQGQEGCHAISTSALGGVYLFGRMGGEIYVSGINSVSTPLPELATQADMDESSITELKQVAKDLLEETNEKYDIEVTRKALCFRPMTSSGEPILARIPDGNLGKTKTRVGAEGGVYIATGNGPWGISQGLGMGKITAELVEGYPLSANVDRLGI